MLDISRGGTYSYYIYKSHCKYCFGKHEGITQTHFLEKPKVTDSVWNKYSDIWKKYPNSISFLLKNTRLYYIFVDILVSQGYKTKTCFLKITEICYLSARG